MLTSALAALLIAPASCPTADHGEVLLSLHEAARQAHLRGDATLIAASTGDQLLLADGGRIRVQSNAEVERFFTGYFNRVRYREWRDVSPPIVTISPDGRIAWMAVEIEAKYTRTDQPETGEKSFRSSWIATYENSACRWRMTAIASNVVE